LVDVERRFFGPHLTAASEPKGEPPTETRSSAEEEVEDSEAHKAKIAEMLISAGADFELKNQEGQTALFSNCYEPKVIEVLLAHGANVDAMDNEGQTPLMDCNWVPTVKVLLNAGANSSLRDKQGNTALDLAREARNEEKFKLLTSFDGSR
jgi:ankyrin repeat protein